MMIGVKFGKDQTNSLGRVRKGRFFYINQHGLTDNNIPLDSVGHRDQVGFMAMQQIYESSNY